MEIIEENAGNKRILKLKGKLDTNTAPELDAAVKTNLEGMNGLILDMAELEYISSAGLRVILSTHKIMSKLGGLTLINVGSTVMEVLEATGFVDVINIE